jgi:hypothetical protein
MMHQLWQKCVTANKLLDNSFVADMIHHTTDGRKATANVVANKSERNLVG